MLISPAYAQAAGGGDAFGMFIPLILIFVVFYFLMIRPQQKKQKEHREMIGALRRGDRIVTNGGLIGSISRVANDNELILEVANGVKVRVLRSMVAELLSKPQPVRRRAKQEIEEETDEDQDFEDEHEIEEEDGEIETEQDEQDGGEEDRPPAGGSRDASRAR